MDWLPLLIPIGGPILAIAVSYWMRHWLARNLLRYGGLYYLITFAIPLILEIDCEWNDLSLGKCAFVPQSLADIVTLWLLLNLVAGGVVVPLLLVIAVAAELRQRLYTAAISAPPKPPHEKDVDGQ